MRLTSALATAAMTSTLLLAGAPAAFAVCDAYSGVCVEDKEKEKPEPVVRARQNTPETLPFTGGEVVMLSALGAAAVATGAGLVLAGRRKQTV